MIYRRSLLAKSYRWIRNRLRKPKPRHEVFFDCPLCALPAEPLGRIVTFDPEVGMVAHIAIQCLGTHPDYTVTDAWFKTNVLSAG